MNPPIRETRGGRIEWVVDFGSGIKVRERTYRDCLRVSAWVRDRFRWWIITGPTFFSEWEMKHLAAAKSIGEIARRMGPTLFREALDLRRKHGIVCKIGCSNAESKELESCQS